MAITAAQVKSLREKTGAGMMDCKNALTDSGGDIDAALKQLREKGLATAAKRAGRTAAEGMVVANLVSPGEGVLLELNCETDFVAKTPGFLDLATRLASVLPGNATVEGVQEADAVGLADMTVEGKTIADSIADAIASMGENVLVRRVARFAPGDSAGAVGAYVHGGGKIGVLVEASTDATGDKAAEVVAVLKDIAMQVAAANPQWCTREDVPAEDLAREKEIFSNQAAQSGKPENVVEKIVTGKVEKFYQQECLIDQEYIRDGQLTIAKLLDQEAKRIGTSIQLKRFARLQLGEASNDS
ncbi:MAG: translation elongation factor Ts [Candidatus Binatia bacterium]|nr:translation elongation factor Ts [Candidatus Binatia bacterium]MDG2009176.1 translation elongation factor Ts [Candidatus Binatia bacterium]